MTQPRACWSSGSKMVLSVSSWSRVRAAPTDSITGLYRSAVILRRGPPKGLGDVENATLEWVARFCVQRILEPLNYRLPAEIQKFLLGTRAAFSECSASINRVSLELRAFPTTNRPIRANARPRAGRFALVTRNRGADGGTVTRPAFCGSPPRSGAFLK